MHPVIDVLLDARLLVAQPDNDFTWSSWFDADHAVNEIDDLMAGIAAGRYAPGDAETLFLPTGPMQELAVSSGWGDRFLALADRFDAAISDPTPE